MARPQAGKAHAEDDERRVICTNRKARHDYTVIETYEAGIELTGTEVKSLRAAKAQLVDAYALVDKDEQLYLRNAHIAEYDAGSFANHVPTRTRRLLMHRAQIRRLRGRLEESGLSLIPLSLYFLKGRVKVELALARGRRSYDKRAKLDERRARKEIRSASRGGSAE
jgi:SsrA-binding protein